MVNGSSEKFEKSFFERVDGACRLEYTEPKITNKAVKNKICIYPANGDVGVRL